MSSMIERPLSLVTVPTGIAGLDTILQGGFLQGGIYLVVGRPGAGKTVLANQVAFHHASGGGRVLYITLLAESHARLLSHLRTVSFFDATYVGDALYYVSGYQTLEEQGLQGLLDVILHTIRDRRASLLVLDGMSTAAVAGSGLTLKRFLHALQVAIETNACTALLLGPAAEDSQSPPAHTMVDGIIEVGDRHVGMQVVRELEVRKCRGKGYLRGLHLFTITEDGITVYPRTEALLARPSFPDLERAAERLSTGIPRLDAMMHDGVPVGSTLLVLGAPGSGKTLLGLSFLAHGAQHGEVGLYYGFQEPPSRLVAKAAGIGLDVRRCLDEGSLQLLWQLPVESIIDALVARLLSAVRAHQVRRVFIDGLGGLQQAEVYPDRLVHILPAVASELRALGVTTLLSAELSALFGPMVDLPAVGIASVADNILFLRLVEIHSRLHRLVSIVKFQGGEYDPAIRELLISKDGLDVADTFASAEAILTGLARTPSGVASTEGQE